MSSGQQLLTILAISLLAILMLNVYNSTGTRNSSMIYNEAIISGTGIAQSMLNEIGMKAFDQKTLTKSAALPDSLTPALSLGPESGETTSVQFNDIDDYNNYTKADTLPKMGIFNTKVQVFYITKLSPDVKSSVRSFTKQINVFVINFSLPDTLKFYRIIAY